MFLVLAFNLRPFSLWIYSVHFQFHPAHRFRVQPNKLPQRVVVFLFLLFVFVRMIGFVRVLIFRFGNAVRDAAAIRALVSQQKFRHMQHIIGHQRFVQPRHGQIQNLMRFEPFLQLRRNFQIINEFIARGNYVVSFHFLRNRRIAFAEDVKSELTYRLGPCRRRCNPCRKLQSARARSRLRK